MAWVFHLFQLLAAGAFIYHALYVSRISRTHQLPIPFTGVVPMAFSAAGYYLAIECMWHTESVLLIRALCHVLWLCGSLFVYFNLIAMRSFLELKVAWLEWVQRIVQALVLLTVASLLGLLFFNCEFLFSPHPGFSPALFPKIVGEVQSPNAVTAVYVLATVFIEVGCYLYFLKKLNSLRRDFWLSAGLVLSLASIVIDLLVANQIQIFNFSILFVAQLVEIIRLTIVIDRSNQERLSRMDEAMRLVQIGELTSTIAHELRTPLTASSVAVEYSLRMMEQDPQLRESPIVSLLQNARRASKKMQLLTDDIGRRARVEVNLVSPFDVAQAVRDSVRLIAPVFLKADVALEHELGDTELIGIGNGVLFQQVLFNLLQNAKDATERRSARKVGVSACIRGECVEVRVRDNGCGIAPEVGDRVFVPFFTTKPAGQGTGIGLAFALNQIKEMGGTIRFESVHGEGTEFVIELQRPG